MAGTFFAWMEDGASPTEKAALRESVPGPVVAIIGGLFGRRYRKEVAPVWAAVRLALTSADRVGPRHPDRTR